ncbi:MAG: cystathionine beta-lyase [Sphingobacteriia bacterium 28-36-52]|nr:MAG: cystathionine beta-lyase [Sphingobacteriia bacterium 28-36-52]
MLSATQLIHSIPVDPLTGAISVPIYQTSTFVQEAPGINKGYDYSRSNNPTRAALENLIAKLEYGATGLAFASGLAAIDAVVKLLKTGDEIVAVDDIYGGAYRLFTAVYEQYGIKVHFVDTSDIAKVSAAITPNTKLIWLETPTNPTLKIADISAIATIAKAHNCLLCVDNTFATPVLQQPLLLGADIVIHSATKYLGGHSDLIAGILVAKDEQTGAKLKFFQNACGAVLAPFDSWLVIRGIETLHLRMKHHCRTAQKVAQYLKTHPAIAEVYYANGGIISFTLVNNTNDAAVNIVSSTQLFKLAESLGGIKSLISHPANMTHKSIPAEKRRAAGVSDSLIRLSIGLEEAEDLIADLANVLDAIEIIK